MGRLKVFNEYLEAAKAAAKSRPINALVGAAMACHETGFGEHTPPGSNNVLGIKAGPSWAGPKVAAGTFEFSPAGERVDDVYAWWRVYENLAHCFLNYGDIIRGLWWYQDAEDNKDDPIKFLGALQPIYGPDGRVTEPGWFTDPKYIQKVLPIMNTYGALTREDRKYPNWPLLKVSELWLNDHHMKQLGSITKARQVEHKLFVETERRLDD